MRASLPIMSPTGYTDWIFSEIRSVYDGPVVQTDDLTVFNVTKDAVVARQAQVIDQLPPTAGKQRVAYTPVLPTPPDRLAEARIPIDDILPPPVAPA
jgi:ribonuclease Z